LITIFPDPRERSAVVAVLVFAILGLVTLVSLDRLPLPLLRRRVTSGFAELSRAGRRLLTDPRRSGAVLALPVATIGLTVLAFKLVGDAVRQPALFR
jgi:hypothetical protein